MLDDKIEEIRIAVNQIKDAMSIFNDTIETQGETLKLILNALSGGGGNELAIAIRKLSEAVNGVSTRMDALPDNLAREIEAVIVEAKPN